MIGPTGEPVDEAAFLAILDEILEGAAERVRRLEDTLQAPLRDAVGNSARGQPVGTKRQSEADSVIVCANAPTGCVGSA